MNKYDFHEEIIYPLQRKLSDYINIEDYGLTVYTKVPDKELSKGCRACKSGTWLCIYVGWHCIANCDFCPQHKSDNIDYTKMFRDKWMMDYKVYVDAFAGSLIKGVSYSGGEPFSYIDKTIPFMEFVTSKGNVYQWIYTNGIIVTEELMKRVSDAGVNEIRFNIAATNFSEKILEKVLLAKNYFQFVTIEIPSIPIVADYLLNRDGLDVLNNIGIDQLNLAEMQIRGPNVEHYSNYPLYEFANEYTCILSPLFSREFVYMIIEKAAVEKKVNYIINDCSNEAKFLQQMMKDINPLNRKIW